MAAGCTNTAAINYDPSASPDDGSCIYVDKVGENCYYFEEVDVDNIKDQSFTLSYAIDGNNYMFFHDYIPDYYFHTREKLHLIKNNKVYTMGEGEPGKYFDSVAKPFFIDIVFAYKDEQTLNSLSWVTEVINNNTGANEEFSTLTHVTIWNSWQTTGRIPITSVFDTLETKNTSRTRAQWTLNDFRDIVKARGTNFLEDIFSNYAVIANTLDANMPWYDKKLVEDDYFIVRLEFDNSANKTVLLHSIDADTTRSTI